MSATGKREKRGEGRSAVEEHAVDLRLTLRMAVGLREPGYAK